jgi:hypothetical protein
MRILGGAGQTEINSASLILKGPAQTLPDTPVADAEIFIKPSAPLLQPIDNADGDDSYVVAWNEVTGALAYVLEEDSSNAFESPASVYSGSDSEVLLQNRAPGTWYYRVFAIGSGTVSQPSNTESATVIMGVPQLYDIANPDGEANYQVEWSAVVGATDYTLQEDDDPAFSSPTTRYLGPDNSFPVTGQPDGTWHYRVLANGPGGATSEWSLPKSTRVGGPLARIALLPVLVRTWPLIPQTPTLQPISNPGGVGDYAVGWSAAARAKTYVLEEGTGSDFVDAETYVTEETSLPFEGYGASRLFYRVKARNPSGESGWSNSQQVDILWEAEPNDSAGEADGPIVSGLTYFGTFPPDAQDVSDYFFFDLPAGRNVEIRLTNIPAGQNYNLVLRDINLQPPRGYSAQPGNSDEYIGVAVPAGRYFIQVFHFAGNGSTQPYHLQAMFE